MTEALLVAGAVVAVTIVVLFAMSLALSTFRRVAAYFVLPVEPPGLLRLSQLLEREEAEREATDKAAGHNYPPPPDIVRVLRTSAGSGG
jgi:hypothetical protein